MKPIFGNPLYQELVKARKLLAKSKTRDDIRIYSRMAKEIEEKIKLAEAENEDFFSRT